jgi:transcriptional regulator with XRE-family HTH domain
VTDIRARFGGAVRASRTRQQLTQEELAERCGLSQKFIGEVERGVANPTIDTVARIASALAVEIGGLFSAASPVHDEPYKISRRDVQMVREAAESLEAVMQRFPATPNPNVRYTRRRRRSRQP